MKIYSVTDPEFKEYGRVIENVQTDAILNALKETPLPEDVIYVPDCDAISSLDEAKKLSLSLFGGLPTQYGYCNGHNTKLNCLEYHRCSEFNLGTEDFILLIARQQEIENGLLDTAKVKAFKAPAGVLIEVYATTLHYAPCHADAEKGFQVLVVLPKGTNEEAPALCGMPDEDKYMTAANKWLLPHPESSEAAGGAVIGLTGINIDLAE